MIFAGIDVNIISHEKAHAAGVDAFGLWCWGMCYAQLHETDGRLPRTLVLRALGGRRNSKLATKLVQVGLWIETPDGHWEIWNYTKKNQTAEEIRAKKTQAAERVRRWRERSRNADVTRNEHVTGNVTQRVRTDPPPEPPPDNTTRKQKSESARTPEGGSRTLHRDEPLTHQRRMDHEALTANLPARDIEPEWRMFVDDRISRSTMFASAAAVDADWRKWVTRENVIQAQKRVKAQNDNGPRSRVDTRQPLRDPNPDWLRKTGTESDL